MPLSKQMTTINVLVEIRFINCLSIRL
jgi:hypothetical protein